MVSEHALFCTPVLIGAPLRDIRRCRSLSRRDSMKEKYNSLWIEVKKPEFKDNESLQYCIHETLEEAQWCNEGDEDVYDVVEFRRVDSGL